MTEDALWERFAAWIGLPASGVMPRSRPRGPRAEDVAFAAASWALCVEYADDLKRAPVSDSSGARRRPAAPGHRCLPRRGGSSPGAPRGLLPADGGRDGGRCSPTRSSRPGPRTSASHRHVPVRGGQGPQGGAGRPGPRGLRPGRRVGRPARGHSRRPSASFWLRDDPARQSAWQLVRDAARLGQAIAPRGRADRRGHERRRRPSRLP